MNTIEYDGKVYECDRQYGCAGCMFMAETICPGEEHGGDNLICNQEGIIFIREIEPSVQFRPTPEQTKFADFIESMSSGNIDWTCEDLKELANDIRQGMVQI